MRRLRFDRLEPRLLLNGDDSWSKLTPFPGRIAPVGSQPADSVAADFNGDGHIDVATGDADGATITILDGTGSGGFAAGRAFAIGSAEA